MWIVVVIVFFQHFRKSFYLKTKVDLQFVRKVSLSWWCNVELVTEQFLELLNIVDLQSQMVGELENKQVSDAEVGTVVGYFAVVVDSAVV